MAQAQIALSKVNFYVIPLVDPIFIETTMYNAKLKPLNQRKNPSNNLRLVELVEWKEFFLQTVVGTATETVVRRKTFFISTGSLNPQNFLREFLSFEGKCFAVYVTARHFSKPHLSSV